MASEKYEIRPYSSEFFPQVVVLFQYLTSNDQDTNKSYFRWKYDDNPHTDSPLGIMALYKGKMVGFRGYFATRFQIKRKNDRVISLCPGDTCVHPDHRRKGLSVFMGEKASVEYAGKFPFFLNLSSTKISLPGYKRMQFLPLATKTYLTRCSMTGLVRFLFNAKKQYYEIAPRIPIGTFGDIIVSHQSRPKEMQDLINIQNVAADKITLYQDEDFFRWRYANRHNKYVFFFRIKNKTMTGYLVILVSPNNRRGYIVDYAQNDETSIEKILKFIIKFKFFDVLSVYNFSLTDDIKFRVQNLGFKSAGLFQTLERRIKGELPLLIRPVKQNYSDSDFFIDDLDLRKIENWCIKGICSDDA